MLRRFLSAVLNGIIAFIVMRIIVVVFGLIGLAVIGAEIAPFVLPIAILVAVLTFFGTIPSYWRDPV